MSIKEFAGRAATVVKAKSPEILLGAGIVGFVASTVLACKATTKLDKIRAEHEEMLKQIEEAEEVGDIFDETYTEEDAKKDRVIVCAKSVGKIIKAYAPAAIVGGLSIYCVLSSHHKMKGRVASIAAAYTTLDAMYSNYRKGVVDRFGEEADKSIRYNEKEVEVEEDIVDEKGKHTSKKVKKKVADPNLYSDYARIFDETCRAWSPNADLNKRFILNQINYCELLLSSRGYLFLNEVYEALGFEPTKAGQAVGWIRDLTGELKTEDDGFISFGVTIDDILRDADHRGTSDFAKGYEPSVVLDFNCHDIMNNDEFIKAAYLRRA